MLTLRCCFFLLYYLYCTFGANARLPPQKAFGLGSKDLNRTVSNRLFHELEELARIVDISYCVGTTGIQKPFLCASRCQEFEGFELFTVRDLPNAIPTSSTSDSMFHRRGIQDHFSLTPVATSLCLIHPLPSESSLPFAGHIVSQIPLSICQPCHKNTFHTQVMTTIVMVRKVDLYLTRYGILSAILGEPWFPENGNARTALSIWAL